jgi:regulation of enolase protein 1 (concanavalin A-like superfamily)
MRLGTRIRSVRSFLLAAVMCGAAGVVHAAVPTPWLAQDVGAPSPAGTASYDSGTFTIAASGVDIWGTSDQFHFVYQELSGDVDVAARVDSLAPTDVWTKAGIMFRSSLSASAADVLVAATPGKGIAFQHRPASGQYSVLDGVHSGIGVPRWVRLVRAGDTITAYQGTDGSQWTKINAITLPLGARIYVGLAVTSHASGITTTSTISNVLIKTTAPAPAPAGVPAPQTAADIGSPALAGSTTYASGVYTINAGGTDIWSTSDEFHYVYQRVSGDVEIIARVSGLGAANGWSKSGVMIRESLDANSRHAFATVTPSNGYAFQRRIDTGGYSATTSGGSGVAPGWVRLVRTGHKFDGYRSTDGNTWTLMGSDTVAMKDEVYVGLAVTSHNATLGTTAKVDNLKITSASSSTNQPPSVSLTSATLTAPATIALAADATDPENRMSHVDFYAGTTLLNSDTTAPYSYSWSSVPAGTYALTAVATDADGGQTRSAAVSVTVGGQSTSDTQPPTTPTNLNATAASATQINLTWTASTDNVAVTGYRIERCQGAGCTTFAQVGTSTTTSYSATGLTASTGYSFRVRAADAAGNLGGYSTTASATTTQGQSTAAIAFVQVNATVPQSPTASPTVPFSSAQSAGDLNVVVVGWNDSTAKVQSVTDTTGNAYVLAVGPTVHSGFASQAIYYAKNIQSAAAGANVVKVVFDQAAQWPDIRIAEYRGLDTTNPLDVKVAAQGDSASSSSGAVSTTSANDLLVGANLSTVGITTGAGTSFTGRVITNPDGDILEDRIVTATGSYSASAPLGASGPWIMQMVAFRAAGSSPAPVPSPSDTQAPTAPTGLAATAASSSQVNLGWTVSTDNVGVTSYLIERCQGAGCTSFTQVGTSTATSYNVTGLSASTSYSFRARAMDAAGNLSAYSTVASATTPGGSTTTPKQVAFTASTDHSTTMVTGYRLEIFDASATPSSASPIATSDLGKPTPETNSEITVDRATFFSGLATGTYQATVSAYGPGGSTRGTAVTFTR